LPQKTATTINFPNAYGDGSRKKLQGTNYVQDNVSLKAREELAQPKAKTLTDPKCNFLLKISLGHSKKLESYRGRADPWGINGISRTPTKLQLELKPLGQRPFSVALCTPNPEKHS
jgi:hypothetical protein